MSITQANVAIITVTYNSETFIEEYLSSIAEFLQNKHHQLVIVDNASHDSTCSIIEKFATTNGLSNNIQIIPLTENVGFGKGCNKGANIAKENQATHLWFLNPDTKIFPGSGEELLSLITEGKTDFAGSVLLNNKSQPRSGAYRFPKLLNIILSNLKLGFLDRMFKKHITAIPIQNDPYKADWLTGASFMTTTKCFSNLKGFDPFYFLYFEEVDLFYRAKKAGHRVCTTPESKVFHISGASTGMNNHKKAQKRRPKYWFESRRHFYIKNFGYCYFAIIDSAFVLTHLAWRARAKIQRKDLNTPPHFLRDIIAHSCFKWPL